MATTRPFDHDDAYRLAQSLRVISYKIPVGHAVDVQALARQVDAIGDALAAQRVVLDVVDPRNGPAADG